MAQYGVACVVTTDAWQGGSRKTGDAANITACLSQNGAGCVTATNAVSEIVNGVGIKYGRYALVLTANERAYNSTRVMFDSATPGVVLPDVTIISDQLRGAREITIAVTESGASPIASVSVAIYDSTQTNVVALCVTDASGIARIQNTTSKPYLDDGSYKIVCSKPGVNFTNPTLLGVDGAETVPITGTVVDPGTPSAGYQMLSGIALRADGTPYVSGLIRIITDTVEQCVDGVAVSGVECEAAIDSTTGVFSIEVQQGIAVVAQLFDDGAKQHEKRFTVSASASATWDSY